MAIWIWIVIALVVLLAIIFIAYYNKFVLKGNRIDNSLAQIDVQLKKRADLVPNLIETVKGYMEHEKKLFTEVTELRTKRDQSSDLSEKSKIENALTRSLGNIFAVAENYPDLKANQNFINLQQQLAEIEDQIQMARRYYNGTVRNFNIMIESFPSNIIANMFNFKKAEFFEK